MKMLFDFLLTDMKRTNPRYLMVLLFATAWYANTIFATKSDVQATHEAVEELKGVVQQLGVQIHEMKMDLRAHMNGSHAEAGKVAKVNGS